MAHSQVLEPKEVSVYLGGFGTMGTVTALKVATALDPGSKPRKKGWSYRDLKPQAAPYSVGIPGYSGVRLRVLPSGRYSVCTTLRVHGRRKWTTIGHVCEATPYEALLHLAS